MQKNRVVCKIWKDRSRAWKALNAVFWLLWTQTQLCKYGERKWRRRKSSFWSFKNIISNNKKKNKIMLWLRFLATTCVVTNNLSLKYWKFSYWSLFCLVPTNFHLFLFIRSIYMLHYWTCLYCFYKVNLCKSVFDLDILFSCVRKWQFFLMQMTIYFKNKSISAFYL